MIKVFISQPMKGKTDEEIKAERAAAIEKIKDEFNDTDVEIIDSFFEGAPHDAKPLWLLGESFKKLSGADVAYFCKGWRDARGCILEYEAAKQDGMKVVVDPDEDDDLVKESLDFG